MSQEALSSPCDLCQKLMTEETEYPAEFMIWVSQKVSVEMLARLAANCVRETAFDPALLVDRALQVLYASWSRMKATKEDLLAKATARD